MKETPLQTVKRRFGTKEKLVDSLVDAVKEAGEEAAEVKQRLLLASNKKLLRLAEVSTTVKDKYGSKDKLAEALGQALGRARDNDYVNKLRTFSQARLLDMIRAAERRVKKSA
ncbi:MAG TPA: hypothetical protein VFG83_18090 [Kofleriaceae bacterium]|nr:hypothetical protein [Kofleriaceae bacterium]